jgi:NADH-quinone oxidoreductase subunit G
MRILPRDHEAVNEEWLSDKSRFVWDGLNTQRLDRPYVRVDDKLQATSWQGAFDAIAARLKAGSGQVAALAGDLVCTEGQFALKSLMEKLGSPHLDCRQDGAKLSGPRANYLFNTGIAGIEDADALLLIGTNPRLEAAVLNARIRKRWLAGNFPIAAIGQLTDLTYDAEFIGAGPQTLAELVAGKHGFADVLAKAERPMLILGQGALARADGAGVFAQALALAEKTGMILDGWNGFNVLHTAAARVGGMDVGFLPGEEGRDRDGIIDGCQTGDVPTVILYGADEIDRAELGDAFVIYVGSHGDRGAHGADVILPAAAYTEKQAIFVNTEGRAQMTERAAFPPGEAREDWKIFRALSDSLGMTLDFDTVDALRATLFEHAPQLARLDTLVPKGAPEKPATDVRDLDEAAFAPVVTDYYFTNPIARASATMAACGEAKRERAKAIGGTGTDG